MHNQVWNGCCVPNGPDQTGHKGAQGQLLELNEVAWVSQNQDNRVFSLWNTLHTFDPYFWVR